MAKLLVVDDAMLTRNIVRGVLEDSGHEVIEAFDGEMGMEMVEKYIPDCIISDHLMPKMDGMRFLQTLRDKGYRIPFIVFSANVQEHASKAFKELGAWEFLVKTPKIEKSPEKEKFLEIVQKAIGKPDDIGKITPIQIDALGELINIGMGQAAGTLNDFLDSYISLETPRVVIFKVGAIHKQMESYGNKPVFSVIQEFQGNFSGQIALIFPPHSASALVAALTGEPIGSTEIDSVRAGTLCEIGNILMNNIVGAICNVLEVTVDFGLPKYNEYPVHMLIRDMDMHLRTQVILMVKTHFAIEKLKIDGNFLILLDTETFDNLLVAVDKLAKREQRKKL